jgi:hypothetical protein
LYGKFKDASTGEFTNEKVYGTYEVGELRNVITDTLTYDDLKADLTPALPDVDEDVPPGSGWVFRFEGVNASGEHVILGGAINMVRSKYAGNYTVLQSDYYRIGVHRTDLDWSGQTRFIGHVDEVTLSYNDFWGPLGWGGCAFHFTVDPDDKSIFVPILAECGLFSGLYEASCQNNKSVFDNVPCDGSNKIVDDEGGEGKHRIYLTYGYVSASGPREFYEVLEKQ